MLMEVPVPKPDDMGGHVDSQLSAGERWYVVYSRPHREATASHHLVGQGYRTFLPRLLKTRRHARKQENVLVPLFPRYLFIVLDINRDRWRSVNGTFGVASLIMEGELPRPAPYSVVEALIGSCDHLGVFHASDCLRVGDWVQVSAGPLSGKLGVLKQLDTKGRVDVLLEFMGRNTQVKIPSQFVIPAPLS